MRKYILAGFFVGVALSAAQAADTAAPAAKPAPVVAAKPAAFNWTGFYMGLNGGYAFGGKSTYQFVAPPGSFTTDLTGLMGGGQFGLDKTAGALLVGIGASIDGGNIKGNTACGPGLADTCRLSFQFLTTETARVGAVIAANTLIYGKGGFAAGDFHENGYVTASGANIEQQQMWATGWTAGAGIEHVLMPHLTLFGEYNYYNLTTPTGTPKSFTGVPIPSDTGKAKSTFSSVLVGLNWR
jgi:outer membrane immunogenic protein